MPVGNRDYRAVVDEHSLDWRHLDVSDLGHAVASFSDLIEPFADGRALAAMAPIFTTASWQAFTFVDVLYGPIPEIPRDERLRLARLIDKCRILEPQESDIPCSFALDGRMVEDPSWGMSHAVALAMTGWSLSCLGARTAPGEPRWVPVQRGDDKADLYVFTSPAPTCGFWRGVIDKEAADEETFFALAGRAFPGLLFAPTVRFNKFKGCLDEVRPWLTQLLAAVDDHFAEFLERHRGDRSRICQEFGSLGLDVSPESPLTRQNASAWGQRKVAYGPVLYLCDWHGKRLPTYDRVHFSRPIPEHDGKILIGIFTEHLGT